jgi:hypothetical protein
MSTVKFAGFSRLKGELKFRTANDNKRAVQLAKLGDTNIDIIQLPTEMSKNDAAKFVLTNLERFAVDVKEAELVLTNLIKDENPFAKPKAVKKPRNTVKVTVPSVAMQKLSGAKVKVTPVEEEFSPKQAAKIRAEFMKQLKTVYEAN